MSIKVKGFFKGLRYISQIFAEEKEEEIQIGMPTDVKHVAHIGSDDPSQNAPSWMTEFKSGTEPSSGTTKEKEKEGAAEGNKASSKGSKVRHLIPKSRHQSIDGDSNSAKTKTARRNRSSDPTADSSNNDSSGGSRHRRHRRGSTQGSESPTNDTPPTGPKPRRKTKTSTSEDSPVKKSSPRTRRASKGDSLSDISLSQELGSSPGPESGPVPN
ncbi:hypothetical protein HN51_047463 [Arachis hypogaea]|uniref:uncharacterized protein isoform X2 n=1 Tax=Arachis hypogaea TaxID=3818 RepID=UPI000DEC2E1C|nr:CRIB domain-containing protein RIC10-like isoform X2 [Arachis hypogaea]QHO23834.1 CRIB domain-containing protein [Arachis hypogaea]